MYLNGTGTGPCGTRAQNPVSRAFDRRQIRFILSRIYVKNKECSFCPANQLGLDHRVPAGQARSVVVFYCVERIQ